jgi:hypothetical protein
MWNDVLPVDDRKENAGLEEAVIVSMLRAPTILEALYVDSCYDADKVR